MNNFLKKIINPLIIKIGKQIEMNKFTRDPILIIACPRSGTTLLLSILSAHPHILTIKRQTYAFDKWGQNEKNEFKPIRLDRLYRELILHKIPRASIRWCEKTPKHIESIDKIISAFPNYKIIHIIRDGRDVVTSKHPKHQPDRYWVSVNRWVKDVSKGLVYSNYKNMYTMKYENLIGNYHHEIKKLLTFLGEEYRVEIKNWYNNTNLTNSKHLKSKIQKLHSNSIGRWKKKEHHNIINQFMKNKKAVNLLQKLKYL